MRATNNYLIIALGTAVLGVFTFDDREDLEVARAARLAAEVQAGNSWYDKGEERFPHVVAWRRVQGLQTFLVGQPAVGLPQLVSAA